MGSAFIRVPLHAQQNGFIFKRKVIFTWRRQCNPDQLLTLFNAWLSAKPCFVLTAKFHPPLPLTVLPRDSLCFADLPCPTLPFFWMSLRPPWAPLPAPCSTNCSRNSVPSWTAPVSTPGSCASQPPRCHPISSSSALASIAPLKRPQTDFQHFPAFLTCPPWKQHEIGAEMEGSNQLSHAQGSKCS